MITMGFGARYLGGAEHQAELLANELGRRGRHVLIYTPAVSTTPGSEDPDPNVRVVAVPCLGLPRMRMATFLPVLGVLQVAPGFERASVLHSHIAWYQAVVPQIAKRLRAARTVVKFACSGIDGELATLSRSRPGRFALNAIRNADRVIALTEAVAVELQSAGFHPERIRRIPNGIGAQPQASPALDLADLPRPIVLFAGRLTEQKGILPFLDVWSRVVDAVEDATLVIAGDGPLDVEVRRRAARTDIADRVRVLGRRTDMRSLLAAADAVVIPSRSEGMSNVALQALSLHRPAFGFAIPGVSEVIEDGRAMATPGDHASLASRVVEALRSSALREDLAASGFERVIRNYSLERVASLYEEVYDELAG
jgi:glycosyltransferase involved in cell wall biosynthesis